MREIATMRNAGRFIFPLLFLFTFSGSGIVGCSSSPAKKPGNLNDSSALSGAGEVDLSPLFFPALPEWARDGHLYDPYYLDIDAVMAMQKIGRFEAVELQNRMKDLLDARQDMSIRDAFFQALGEIRKGQYESGWKPIEFKNPGDFVLVLDMDETLLAQWHKSSREGFNDLTLSGQGAGPALRNHPGVKFAPGAEKFIKRMRANPHCRGIVIFTGKTDGPALEIMDKWVFSDGTPAKQYVNGIFTEHHLVMERRRTVASKDLRIVDPELKHVVLVDDNPDRVIQSKVVRAHPRFDADLYYAALKGKDRALTGGPGPGARAEGPGDTKMARVKRAFPLRLAKSQEATSLIRFYEHLFDVTAAEIEESAQAAQKLGIPFNQAFLPYSYWGERVFRSAWKDFGSREKALLFTRMNPALQGPEPPIPAVSTVKPVF